MSSTLAETASSHESTPRLLILYGSQTGKAWYIAQDVYLNCKGAFNVEGDKRLFIHCQAFNSKQLLIQWETMVIFVVATVGQGECPYSTVDFWNSLCEKDHPELPKLKYALFGLGDSNYVHYAIFAKQLDERLQQLKATKICPTGFGDDAEGIDIGYSPWLYDVIEAFAKILPSNEEFMREFRGPRGADRDFLNFDYMCFENIPSTELTLPVSFSDKFVQTRILNDTYDYRLEDLSFEKLPLMDTPIHKVRLCSLKRLTGDSESVTNDETKVILQATFETDEDFPCWVPGDAFGFIVGHSDFEVYLVLKALKLQDKASCICYIRSTTHHHLPRQVTVFNLFKYYIDLRAIPKKSNLRFFGDYCSLPSQKLHLHFLSSREGAEDYKKLILECRTTILDILVSYNTCCPPLDYFLAIAPNFVPRYYSVSNLINEQNRFQVAFRVITHSECNNRRDSQLLGVFTGLMYKIALGWHLLTENAIQLEAAPVPDYFRVFRKKNDHFKLKPNVALPIIMVAAGTGITPFISFLNQRQYWRETRPNLKLGEAWLFYGCRHQNQDYIFSEELKQFEASGILTKYFVCFSRDCPSEYIEHKIMVVHEDIGRLCVKENAVVYVCGDAEKFSSNVRKSFVTCIEVSRTGPDSVRGEPYMDQMREQGRYVHDLWV